MKNSISYEINKTISTDQYIALLKKCSLGERRPIHDNSAIQSMLDHANLTASAWYEEKLIGIARCWTDYAYVTYLSDLAVNEDFQGKGIGTELIRSVQSQILPSCRILLFAAPTANDYYPKLGFESNTRGWVLNHPLS